MFNKITKMSVWLVMPVLMITAGCTAITDFTSSTSSTLDAVTPDITLNHYVDMRIAAIRKEAAIGNGEHLDALAELMGEHDADRFSRWMKNNYSHLFDNLSQPTELVGRLDQYHSDNNMAIKI